MAIWVFFSKKLDLHASQTPSFFGLNLKGKAWLSSQESRFGDGQQHHHHDDDDDDDDDEDEDEEEEEEAEACESCDDAESWDGHVDRCRWELVARTVPLVISWTSWFMTLTSSWSLRDRSQPQSLQRVTFSLWYSVIRLRSVSVFANNRFLAATNVLSLVVVELILPMLVSLQVPLSIFSSLPPFPFQPLNSVIEVRRHSSGGHLFEGCDWIRARHLDTYTKQSRFYVVLRSATTCAGLKDPSEEEARTLLFSPRRS